MAFQVFEWNVKIQSVILSSFSWGYFILQIPAGEMASRFGAKILVCVSVGLNAFLTLLTPVLATYVRSCVSVIDIKLNIDICSMRNVTLRSTTLKVLSK